MFNDLMFLKKIFKKIIFRNKILRRLILLKLDALLLFISFTTSNFFIKNNFIDNEYFIYKISIFISIGILVFIFSGQYKAISLYVGGTLFYRSILRNTFLIIIFFLISSLDKRLFLDQKFNINWFFDFFNCFFEIIFERFIHRINVSKNFT